MQIKPKSNKITFIAPASCCHDITGQLDIKKSYKRLEELIAFYQQYGFTCNFDPNIFYANKLGFVAAPRFERLRQLRNALLDQTSDIIIAFRGGYGSSELIFDCLDIKPVNKILIGFSDITALHFLFNQHYQLPSIHGAMSPACAKNILEIIEIIRGKEKKYDLVNINSLFSSKNPVKAKLVGGNLSLICHLIGSQLQPNFADKIILIEEINEKPYALHRLLLQLKNAQIFAKAKAIIFADLLYQNTSLDQLVAEFCQEHIPRIPIYKLANIGHGRINQPIILGQDVLLANNQLLINSPFLVN